ncbi:hypothetical protein F4679DRAFT_478587 [Xylaria curta]|nr:hypothetical protein F4679DRAFT_478587 [Xylaria curta]
MLEESEVPALIHEFGVKYPKMKSLLNRSSLRDLLFQDTYPHSGPSPYCDGCDVSKLVEREQRHNDDPQIHYGVIASGNSLIRFPERRTQLVKEWQALCFEMEGAGIIESLQCLVIRSICDYADSHKNKLWQPYAAAAAAAYAKELILAMPIFEDQEHRMVRHHLSSDDLNRIMDSLSFEGILFRELNIKPPHGSTCKWILHHPSYLTWLDTSEHSRHHGFLWIRGKPGAGKSTLMKFIYQNMKNSFETISFFFNARGNQLEKSVEGMYRSLLLQLLQKSSTSQQEQVFRHYPHLHRVKQGSIKWDNGTLQDIFSKTISQFDQEELICFIDALDECNEDDIIDTIEYFETLASLASKANVVLLICLSGRHYPSIPAKYGITLILEDQEGHSRGLEQYVSHKLNPSLNDMPEIRDTLLRKSAGVFMWVVLVVNMLNREHQRGRIFAIKKRLNEIPDKLSELFKDMLNRDNENMNEFKLSIQWILFAREPLNPAEYYYALLSGFHERSELGMWDDHEMTIENMAQYVLTSSKGLAEVTKLSSPRHQVRELGEHSGFPEAPDTSDLDFYKSLRVQFIHESVQDFLLKDGGINEIWPNLSADFPSYSHDRLKQCCHTYIEAMASNTQAVQDMVSYLQRRLNHAWMKSTMTYERHELDRGTPFSGMVYWICLDVDAVLESFAIPEFDEYDRQTPQSGIILDFIEIIRQGLPFVAPLVQYVMCHIFNHQTTRYQVSLLEINHDIIEILYRLLPFVEDLRECIADYSTIFQTTQSPGLQSGISPDPDGLDRRTSPFMIFYRLLPLLESLGRSSTDYFINRQNPSPVPQFEIPPDLGEPDRQIPSPVSQFEIPPDLDEPDRQTTPSSVQQFEARPDLEDIFCRISPFAEYAVQHVAYHSIYAAASLSQHCFLKSFDFETWTSIYLYPRTRGWFTIKHHWQEWPICEEIFFLLTSQRPVGVCETSRFSDSIIDDHTKVNNSSFTYHKFAAKGKSPVPFSS